MIGIDDVLCFPAQDKCVRVLIAYGGVIIRTALKEALAAVDPDQFWKVHRGMVVRVQAMDRVRRTNWAGMRLL